MIINYMNKLNIGLPKIILTLDEQTYTIGSTITGQIEIKGGFSKNKIKRYEIDLTRVSQLSLKEEILNSRCVLCSQDYNPNNTEVFPFILNIPNDLSKLEEIYRYFLVIRVVLANSHTVIHKQDLKFN